MVRARKRSACKIGGLLRISVCACIFLNLTPASAEEQSPFAQQLTRLLNPALREDEQALTSLRKQLEELPPLSTGHSGSNIGFHSRFQPERNSPLELTIDLGRSFPVERIAVFPVRGMFRGTLVDGYGFPRHFVIELSQDADFSNPVHTLDSQASAVHTRPDYPIQFALKKPEEVRFLKIKVLEHWTREDGRFLSAFGEVMVLAEKRNVALRASVEADSYVFLPDWHHNFIVDGLTDHGLPVSPEPSPTNGFLARRTKDPNADRWIQIELPHMATIDEVTLIPAQPVDVPDQFGHGFPRKFRLRISEDPNFSDSRPLFESAEWNFPNPGDNPVSFSGDSFPARFVRLEVSEQWRVNVGQFTLSLAEMQVFEKGVNVAEGTEVTASDVFAEEPFLDVWQPEYLVDGFSSQNRLISLQNWLTGLEERRNVESQIAALNTTITSRIEQTLRWVLGLFTTIVIGSLGLVALLILRRKQALTQQQESLRARIARDLHDDLGSRLSGMRLLSESLLHSDELPSSFQQDLDLLHRSSGEATDAMRDIVWLLDTRERSLEKLRQQLKLLVPSILGSVAWEFHIDEDPDAEVAFEFRRQVILAFRESLNNAARHSGSSQFECRVGGDREHFWFEVRDWGKGFDRDTVKRGLGLTNLRKRAETLNGTATIESAPEIGTTVRFSAPYRTSKHRRLP